jgi:hypothetical protein
MSSRIEDYALIGDCETAALVSKDGSIDWLCWPRFDSEACFAALLGDANNGRWRIAPAAAAGMDANVRVRRRYRRDTLILETEFTTTDGGAVARHTIGGHDQVNDPGAADDLRAMAKPRGGQHGMRVDYRIEPTLLREKRHRRFADRRRIDVGLQFLHLAQRDPLRSITPGPQLLDVFTLRRAIGFGLPFQTPAAVSPRRGAELVSQRGMGLHADDIQIVIWSRRLFVRVGPGETDAGSATANASRFQHRNSGAGLSRRYAIEAPNTPAPITIVLINCLSSGST